MINKTKDFDWKIYEEFFNAGYIINKHAPEILASLDQSKRDDDYKIGALMDGYEEWEMEKENAIEKDKDRMPSWLKDDPFKMKIEDMGMTPDKDKDLDIEPEI